MALAQVAHGIALGLQHIASLGWVHGDVQPRNLLLQPDSAALPLGMVVKLCDFGLSRQLLDPEGYVDNVHAGTPVRANSSSWMSMCNCA